MTIPQASLLAVQSLGISKPAGFDGTFATFGTLGAEDRIAVTRWVRNYVADNPALFTSQEVTVANTFEDVGEQIDESFDYDLFWSEVGANAQALVVTPIEGIGQASGVILNLLPLLLIAGAVYFLTVNSSKLKL